MKSYPHIEYWNKGIMGATVFGFDKLDGSNIRAEWSKKRGWYKFGTRNCMIDEKHEQFGHAVTLFNEKYGDGMAKVFKDNKQYRNIRSFVAFCEYAGPNSFAGFHYPDDKMDIVLFDVSIFQKGWVPPKQFINDFEHLGIPRLIYHGNLNKELVNDIKEGKYDVKEGIMAKGIRKTKGNDIVWMVKLKTNWWLDKVKGKFGDEVLRKELNGDLALVNAINNPGIIT